MNKTLLICNVPLGLLGPKILLWFAFAGMNIGGAVNSSERILPTIVTILFLGTVCFVNVRAISSGESPSDKLKITLIALVTFIVSFYVGFELFVPKYRGWI